MSAIPITFPLITRFVSEGVPFEEIFIDLLNPPGRPIAEYLTSITPVPPGAIGALGKLGTVHPQVAFAFTIIRGASPVFLNLKE